MGQFWSTLLGLAVLLESEAAALWLVQNAEAKAKAEAAAAA